MEENRITVVQALDERDLLVKKIMNKTQKAQFVDMMKPKAAVTWEKRVTKAAFAAEAKSALQQIQDLIARYDRLNAAITLSNAATFLETSQGRMTVSCAIALRNRLRGSGPYGELTDFEGRLVRKMESSYKEEQELQRKKNEGMRREASAQKKGSTASKNSARVVLLQSAGAQGKSRKISQDSREGRGTGAVSEGSRQEKSVELMRIVDPLNIRRKAEEIAERREALLAELETKIKISNATTFVTIEGGRAASCAPEMNVAAQVPAVTEEDSGAEKIEHKSAAGRAEQQGAAGKTEQQSVAEKAEQQGVAGKTEQQSAAGRAEQQSVAGETEQQNVAEKAEQKSVAEKTEQ